MKNNINKYILLFSYLSLIIIIIFLWTNVSKLKEEKNTLTIEFNKYQDLMENKIINLTDSVGSLTDLNIGLEDNLKDLEEKNKRLNKEHSDLKKEVTETIQTIEDYQNQIQESIEWFKINSDIENAKKVGLIQSSLQRCYQLRSDDTCYIKLGCIQKVNDGILFFDYIDDIKSTGSEDKLQSLSDFVENMGGDCEDYSLFYKAEFREILRQCKEKGTKSHILESWVYDRDAYRYVFDFQDNWDIFNAKEEFIEPEYINPNVVCFSYYDSVNDDGFGHCIIAFTKNKINSMNDIEKELDMAPIIEPQDAMYLGLINDLSSEIYLLNEGNEYLLSFVGAISFVEVVVTDNDYFLFDNDEMVWMSHSKFYDELENNKKSLMKLT